MSHPKQSPAILWGERVVLFALAVYFSLHTMPRAWKSLITDFPNYYIAAQLAHEGVDMSRMYEWEWLEREKDHQAIPIRVIALVPIAPFSTLFVWPLSGLKALTAKRVWIFLSLALLVPIAWMMRSMTGLSYVRIGLIFALNFPLYRNIEIGQFYVFLLAMIVPACWATMRGQNVLSGALVSIAAVAKIFPLLFVVFFFGGATGAPSLPAPSRWPRPSPCQSLHSAGVFIGRICGRFYRRLSTARLCRRMFQTRPSPAFCISCF